MPEINYEVAPLIIELPDLVDGDLVIKRKATVIEQIWDLVGKQVRLTFDINPFKNDNGNYGDRLDTEDSIFVSRRTQIKAFNNFFVNAQTGKTICKVAEEFDGDQVLNPLLENITYMKDYDFYFMVANTQPIILAQLIGQAILASY